MNNIADLLRGLEAVADGEADPLPAETRICILICLKGATRRIRNTLVPENALTAGAPVKPADAVVAGIVSNSRGATAKNAEIAERKAA